MALREIRKKGDNALRKICKPVTEVNKKIRELLDDMLDTMYEAEGVGLAAPQVGILKRIAVVDIGEGPVELINPEKLEESGEQLHVEGCLSIPGIWGEVKRPERLLVKSLDRDGKEQKIDASGMLAIAICHEMDHLDGILFEDRVIRYIDMNKEEEED
ncbi:MAG: peptide deformylase [Thermoclostridium sp.]|nr:peptide deformylase [Thermoclostridium sp.]